MLWPGPHRGPAPYRSSGAAWRGQLDGTVLYFLLLDNAFFSGQVRPALTASWRQRSFGPCAVLCREIAPRAAAFAERYHLGPEGPLLAQVARGLPFERVFWQHLVGEVLWYGALEIPEVQTAADTLAHLLAPGAAAATDGCRSQLVPIQQVHHGSRELTFGTASYRPGFAGWNELADIERLAGFLASVRPDVWNPDQLAS